MFLGGSLYSDNYFFSFTVSIVTLLSATVVASAAGCPLFSYAPLLIAAALLLLLLLLFLLRLLLLQWAAKLLLFSAGCTSCSAAATATAACRTWAGQ